MASLWSRPKKGDKTTGTVMKRADKVLGREKVYNLSYLSRKERDKEGEGRKKGRGGDAGQDKSIDMKEGKRESHFLRSRVTKRKIQFMQKRGR